jgi:hypothetical protein
VGTNIITNAATYGELPWRIYKTDLEERYKVLNALKYTKLNNITFIGFLQSGQAKISVTNGTWGDVEGLAEDDYKIVDYYTNSTLNFACFSGKSLQIGSGYTYTNLLAEIMSYYIDNICVAGFNTNIFHKILSYQKAERYPNWTHSSQTFDNNELLTGLENVMFLWYEQTVWSATQNETIDINYGLSAGNIPNWCPNATESSIYMKEDQGFQLNEDYSFFLSDWQFQYCTNKYW